MKNYLLLVLLIVSGTCFAQNNILEKPFSKMLKAERDAHIRLENATVRTIATNNFNVYFYRCEWQIDPAVRFIQGKITSYFTVTTATNTITYDLSKALTVDSVTYKGNKIAFMQTADNGLQIQFPTTLNSQQKDSVSVYYKGVPVDDGFGSFVKDAHSGVPVIWTLSEPYGAKDWWPCKNGLDDKADSIDIVITVPNSSRASTNGLLKQELDVAEKKISYYQHRYPIATYLIGFAVTNYQLILDSVQVKNKKIPLQCFAYPEDAAVFQSEIGYAKRAMQVFCDYFQDYPYSKERYAQTQFGWGGGIEHQTNSFIVWPNESLQTHELAHQWFGDKVTCGSWQDLWLNEGWATYLQLLVNEKNDLAIHYFTLNALSDYITQDSTGSVWVSDTANVNRLFDGRLTYYKGAYVLHMLRWVMGDSAFFAGANNYLNDPLLSFGFARTADFKKHMENASGKNLNSFFNNWFYGQGHPEYALQWKSNANNWVHLKLDQTTGHPSVSFFDMPVPIQFKNVTRDTIIVVNNTANHQQFWVNPGFAADSVFIDPKFWILKRNNKVTKITAASTLPNDIKVYPNPAPTQVNVLWQNPSGNTIQIKLFNSIGQLLTSKTVPTSGKDELINIPTQTLPRGIYILQAENDNGVKSTKKIIK